MKKTAIVLSVVSVIAGFASLWIGASLLAATCFIVSASWVALVPKLDSK